MFSPRCDLPITGSVLFVHVQPKVWPGFRKNEQSVGELWMGFLRFYLEDFDWKGMVVTVRQSNRLTKFEKMWTGKTIAVEGTDKCVCCWGVCGWKLRGTWVCLCEHGGSGVYMCAS